MELNKRILYISYIIIGLIFVITGMALNETEILRDVFESNSEQWYTFLMPWLGDSNTGIPVPWE
ncbi:MAG: hypothetical protein INQ03_04845 [Candidatus Heimdallarchaeota archaeon]|nr:hypothetical protein [Candidatus Heimdallarchaeota archaeon]